MLSSAQKGINHNRNRKNSDGDEAELPPPELVGVVAAPLLVVGDTVLLLGGVVATSLLVVGEMGELPKPLGEKF